jgi:predicted dehydrogenase
VIGAGKMGRSHARALSTIPGVEIVAIAGRTGDRAARLAEDLGVRAWGTDWESLADETAPDAAVVAVSHGVNEAITGQAIERGLHVLAEKPVAFSSERVRALARRADERGVIAMAAMNRRYYPGILAAREIVAYHGGVLGVTGSYPDPVQPARADRTLEPFVYAQWTVANTLHMIDLMRFAGGEVERISGEAAVHGPTGECSAVVTFRFQGGGIGTFSEFPTSAGRCEMKIHGDGVEADLDPLEDGVIRVGEGPARPLPTSRDPRGIKAGVRPQALGFVEAIRDVGRASYPASDLHDHAESVALAEQIAGIIQAARER